MALIYFYDSTDLDKQQLASELQHTDHHWEFVQEQISVDNIHPDTEVLSVFVSSTVTKEIIEKLPKLKLIACRSTGYNNIDMGAAAAKGVTVVNVPSYGERTVAEYTFALLLSLTRKITTASSDTNTDDQPLIMGTDLYQKTIGVIGTGRIGSNVIKIANGFGMNILAYDPFPKDQLQQELNFKYVDFNDLLAQSDVITLHVPFLDSNKHLLNEEAFKKMKRGVIVINTSRGELIDATALIEALQSGKVSQVGLDVIESEHIMSLRSDLELLQSKKTNSQDYLHSIELLALQRMHSVLITPHNAFNTVEALGRINQTTADNIVKFWYGNIPNKVQVTKQVGKLFIVRHSESEWNALGKWTGTTDVHLSEKGFREAALLGRVLPDISLDKAYASQQIRTLETLEGILDASGHFDVPIERIAAINERDYGEYTGKNKWEVKEQLGEEEFNKLRRDWNYPIAGGESLKDVSTRVLPFYKEVVLPQLTEGKNILITAHGNSIRALMQFIESIPEQKMSEVEMIFGTIVQYEVDSEGKMTTKQEFKIDSPAPPA